MVFEGISTTKKMLLESIVDEKPKLIYYPPFRTGGNIIPKDEKKPTKPLVSLLLV